MDTLDIVRAAGVGEKSASQSTTGDEPLVIDLVLSSRVDVHCIVEQLTLIANLTVRQPGTMGTAPISGLFLCPPSTPRESLADAQAGWNVSARPYLLPAMDPYIDSAIVGAAPNFAIAMSLQAGFKITVPALWFLRAIVTCQAGTPTPGPGAQSNGLLRALYIEESNTLPGC